MHLSSCLALLLSACQTVAGQDGGLASAISSNTELSGFQRVLDANPAVFNSILPSDMGGITVLVPTNAALDKFYNKTGQHLETLAWDNLTAILRYHTFAAPLTNSNFTSAQDGLAVPTLLKGSTYNNRSAGAALLNQFGAAAAEGNVVFLSKDRLNPAKLRIRQAQADGAPVSLRGGLASDATITPVDGRWALGYYQIIDSILEPPRSCSRTIRSLRASLQGLYTALNRTKIWSALDTTPNVTCLAPNNDAFKAAGNPQTNLDPTELQGALLFHTLPEVTYSNFLQDGAVFKSLQGGDVKVTIVDDDIYFNNAKLVSPNVLTNNGLIHVIDQVMSPNGTAPAPTTGSTPSASASPSPTGNQNSGPRTAGTGSTWAALLAFAVAAVPL